MYAESPPSSASFGAAVHAALDQSRLSDLASAGTFLLPLLVYVRLRQADTI